MKIKYIVYHFSGWAMHTVLQHKKGIYMNNQQFLFPYILNLLRNVKFIILVIGVWSTLYICTDGMYTSISKDGHGSGQQVAFLEQMIIFINTPRLSKPVAKLCF